MRTINYKNSTIDDNRWAMYIHASALLGSCIPLANVLAPLVIWISKKDENETLNRHGVVVLNFQLSMVVYFFIAGLFSIILIGLPFLFGLMIYWVYKTIVNSVRAANGEELNYPMSIEFIKMQQ